MRFLDNIIDINKFPSDIYENYQKRYRTIGLGYTGLADALVMLGYQYNSTEARAFVSDLTEMIALTAYEASVALAGEKGEFPGLHRDKFISSGFLTKHAEKSVTRASSWKKLAQAIRSYGIRNAKLMSVAPTGTMSLVFGNNCSSGIEPIFSLSYDRRVKMGGQSEDDVQIVSIEDYAYGLHRQLKERGEAVYDEPPFVTALEMSVKDHVEMLAAIAYNVDMSVSKTINVPEDYPFEQCKDIYTTCWLAGIKGCTIFRPNPLRQGVLMTPQSNTKPAEERPISEFKLGRGDVICCDDTLIGMKRKLTTGCGTMHLQAWYDAATGDIMEVFVGRGSSGGCEKNLTAMTRLISVGLRGGVPFDYVMDQLESCGGCDAYRARRVTKHDTSPGSSCATAIAIALREMQREIYSDLYDDEATYEEEETDTNDHIAVDDAKPRCPECGEEVSFEGGCNICKSCGWSKCG